MGGSQRFSWLLLRVLRSTWRMRLLRAVREFGLVYKEGTGDVLISSFNPTFSFNPNTDMKITIACATLSIIASAAARSITVQNNCPFTVWSVHLTLAPYSIDSWRVVCRPAVRDGSPFFRVTTVDRRSIAGLHWQWRWPYHWVRPIPPLWEII